VRKLLAFVLLLVGGNSMNLSRKWGGLLLLTKQKYFYYRIEGKALSL